MICEMTCWISFKPSLPGCALKSLRMEANLSNVSLCSSFEFAFSLSCLLSEKMIICLVIYCFLSDSSTHHPRVPSLFCSSFVNRFELLRQKKFAFVKMHLVIRSVFEIWEKRGNNANCGGFDWKDVEESNKMTMPVFLRDFIKWKILCYNCWWRDFGNCTMMQLQFCWMALRWKIKFVKVAQKVSAALMRCRVGNFELITWLLLSHRRSLKFN